MAPAFSSARQAGAYVLLLAALLLLPLLVGKRGLPPRQEIYSSISWQRGSFPYMCQQIFEEKGDVDIVFMGSSHIYADIDTPYIQKQLSEKLGRPATVFTLGWNYAGLDSVYFFAKELLDHRKVHMLVIYDDVAPNWPHPDSWRWVRYGDNDEDIAGLPFRFRMEYYYGSILSMPRNLLSRLRPNLETIPSPDSFYRDYPGHLYPPDHLGAMVSQEGYLNRPDLFEKYSPGSVAALSDVCVYAQDTRDKFQFSNAPIAPFQGYFAKKLTAIAKEHSVHLVCLSLPVVNDQRDTTIPDSRLWIDCLSPNADLVGVVPARLFKGLDDDDVRKLYQNTDHMNENGQAYFTRIISPTLIQLYEQSNP